MQIAERKQNDGTDIYYIEHEISPEYRHAETGEKKQGAVYMMIECTTKQQAITILKQLHATNDIYTETR